MHRGEVATEADRGEERQADTRGDTPYLKTMGPPRFTRSKTFAGADPSASVLDGHCKAHDLENLWVVDGGFFPSSAAMNPALTIAAQALRVVAESDLVG